MRLREGSRKGSLAEGVMEYEVDGTLLRHAFTTRLLSDDELDAELAAAGLRRSRALDERGTWIEAAPHARPR